MIKRYRQLNFFQHDCFLQVRVPRVTFAEGQALQVEPGVGKRSGFTLLFEAMVLALCREMPFAVVAPRVGRVGTEYGRFCGRYVALAVAATDLSQMREVAIDETSCRCGHDDITVVAAARPAHAPRQPAQIRRQGLAPEGSRGAAC